MDPTRRLVVASVSCVACLPLGAAGVAAAHPDDPITRLRSLLPLRAGAVRVGRAYRQQYPTEAHASELARLTLSALALSSTDMATLTDEALCRRLDALIRTEFAQAATVLAEGWMLSRTEARLCALCV